jgi:hypothetical protein
LIDCPYSDITIPELGGHLLWRGQLLTNLDVRSF